MDTNLGDALSGLLLLSSDSNNDSDDGSTTHIAFCGFSILLVRYAHAPSSRPLPSWLSPSSRSSSSLLAALGNPPPSAIRCPRQSAALGDALPLAIRRRWQSAALGDPPPCRHLLPPLDLPEARVEAIPVAPHI